MSSVIYKFMYLGFWRDVSMPIRIIPTNSIRMVLVYWLKCTCWCQSRVSARVPNTTERTALKNACLRELSGSSVLTVVHDFVRFCDLLARPENHIRIPSTQYIETQVNTYTTQEMTNQMAKELMELPPRTA